MRIALFIILVFQIQTHADQNSPIFELKKGESVSYLVNAPLDGLNKMNLSQTLMDSILRNRIYLSDTNLLAKNVDIFESGGVKNQSIPFKPFPLRASLGEHSEEWKLLLKMSNRHFIAQLRNTKMIQFPFAGLPILLGLIGLKYLPPVAALNQIQIYLEATRPGAALMDKGLEQIQFDVPPFAIVKTDDLNTPVRIIELTNLALKTSDLMSSPASKGVPQPIFLREIKDALDVLVTTETIKAVLQFLIAHQKDRVDSYSIGHIPYDTASPETLALYAEAVQNAESQFADEIASHHSDGVAAFVSLVHLEFPNNGITTRLEELGFTVRSIEPDESTPCLRLLEK